MYDLQASQPDGTVVRMTNAHGAQQRLTAPVTAEIAAPAKAHWTLCVVPAGGWTPAWRDGLLALVAALSAVVGVLLLGLLINRERLAQLLQDLQVCASAP